MQKKSFANRFGIVALISLSLFASNAFAGTATGTAAAQGPQQVVVTNTPAQPVPVVGLVKDSDAPARKPFQTGLVFVDVPTNALTNQLVTTVPPNQRLVIERATGYCDNVQGTVILSSNSSVPGAPDKGDEFLPVEFQSAKPAATSPSFYVDPGFNFSIKVLKQSGQFGTCSLTFSGYYVNLP